MFLHGIMSGLPLDVSTNKSVKFIPALGPLLGASYASMLGGLPPILKFSLIGIITGALLFSITRHQLPYGKKGSPAWFLAGVTIYVCVIVLSWTVLPTS